MRLDVLSSLDRYLARIAVTGVLSQERHGYVIPVRPRRDGFVRGRVLLVGDAAGFADALTGEGISIAIASARIAADALAGSAGPDVRASYQRAVRREVLTELRVGRALAWVTYRRHGLRRALFRARGSEIAERVTDVFLGEQTYRSLVSTPSNYLRLLRAPTARAAQRV